MKHNGLGLLYVAAINGRLNVVRVLLEHKADMNALVSTEVEWSI